MEIVVVKIFKDLPHIVKTNEGKFYQISYIDELGRLRKYKELTPTLHHGSLYYRINRERYSEYKLETLSKKYYTVIDLNKKIIKNGK